MSLLGSKNLLSGTQSQHQKEVSPPPATPAFPTTLKRRRRKGDVDSDDEDLPNRYGVTLEKKQCLRGESGAHDHGAGSERGLGKVRIAPYKEHEKVSVRSHRVSGLSDEESEDMNKSIPRTLESPKLSDEGKKEHSGYWTTISKLMGCKMIFCSTSRTTNFPTALRMAPKPSIKNPRLAALPSRESERKIALTTTLK